MAVNTEVQRDDNLTPLPSGLDPTSGRLPALLTGPAAQDPVTKLWYAPPTEQNSAAILTQLTALSGAVSSSKTMLQANIVAIGGQQVGMANPLFVQQAVAAASANGSAFVATTSKQSNAASGIFPLSVFNPVGSGKTLVVYSALIATTSGNLSTVAATTVDPAFGTPVVAQNEKPGGGVSVASCTQSLTTVSLVGTPVGVITTPSPAEILTQGEVKVLAPGNGITVYFQPGAAASYGITIKWWEQFGPFNFTQTLGVSYGPNGAQLMDIYQPTNMTTAQPCLMFVHGGAWTGGSSTGYGPICQQYARMGYVCASVNYRLTPANIWPTQINDVQLAVRFLRQNAATYGIDQTQICGVGDSAGAHLALLCGLLTTIHSGDMSGQLPAVSPHTQATIDQFGPADLTLMYNQGPPSIQTILFNLFGGTPTTQAAAYADASPINNIPTTPDTTAQVGPILIIQGTNDLTVPPIQSQNLYKALQAKGYYPQYQAYLGDHEFSTTLINGMNLFAGLITQFLMTYVPHN